MVSTQSEEALTARATTIHVLQVGAVLALMAGLGLMVFDLVKT